jgi:hypothetical protein
MTAPVVGYLGAGLLVVAAQPDLAAPGPAVTDHVGRALAHDPGQHGIRLGRRGAQAVLDPAGNARRLQHLARAVQFFIERRPPVAGDGLPHLPQGPSRHAFDVVDFGGGLLRRGRQQASGQLAL